MKHASVIFALLAPTMLLTAPRSSGKHAASPQELKKKNSHPAPHKLSYSWKNPKIQPSPPPPLTGKQMGVIDTPGIPPLGYEMDGNVKVFRLYAQPIEQFITNGKEAEYEKLIPAKNKFHHHDHMNIVQKIHAWGFNGSTPGPTIEAHEGDRIRLVVTNELPEPMTVH